MKPLDITAGNTTMKEWNTPDSRLLDIVPVPQTRNRCAERLEAAQRALYDKIARRAVALGFDPETIEPVYDGVADPSGYLAAKPRLMWILKEPYDGWDAAGNPCGGGWTILKDFGGDGKTLAEVANGNTALRNVAYASRALLDGVASYADLPWISDDLTTYDRALRSVAFLNVGKMPSGQTTSDAKLAACYADWKNVLFRQIDLYDPEIIVFGNTLPCFAPDLGLDLSKSIRSATHGGSTVDIHFWRGKRLLWAPHPSAVLPPRDWVDSILEAARMEI